MTLKEFAEKIQSLLHYFPEDCEVLVARDPEGENGFSLLTHFSVGVAEEQEDGHHYSFRPNMTNEDSEEDNAVVLWPK